MYIETLAVWCVRLSDLYVMRSSIKALQNKNEFRLHGLHKAHIYSINHMDTNTHTPRRSQHKHEHVLVLVLTLPQYVCSVADNQCGNYFLSENSIF